MALVATDGKYYIKIVENKAAEKTKNAEDAYQFDTLSTAIKKIFKMGMNKNYYVQDTFTGRVLWKEKTQEQKIREQEAKALKRCKNKRIKRKQYSKAARKLIYNNAGGRCQLCGRSILLEDMTLDHVIPLAAGGIDSVENLACTCYPCNHFKDKMDPSDFYKRITEIFLFQIEKKSGNRLKWKIVHRILVKMI